MEKAKKSAVFGIKVLDISSSAQRPQHVAGRDFYSLSYRYGGEIRINADGRSYSSERGSLTFIPRGQSYVTEILRDTRMVVVHFTLGDDIEFLRNNLTK